MNKLVNKLFVYLFFAFNVSWAQECNQCITNNSNESTNIYITGKDTSNYTLTEGKTLCIRPGGFFNGALILNGGDVCNNGNFSPKSLNFNSGVIVNKNKIRIPTLILTNGKTIRNISKANIIIVGSLTISGGKLYNDGLLNVKEIIQNDSGQFLNRGIVNCNQLSGSGNIINTGIVNSHD